MSRHLRDLCNMEDRDKTHKENGNWEETEIAGRRQLRKTVVNIPRKKIENVVLMTQKPGAIKKEHYRI